MSQGVQLRIIDHMRTVLLAGVDTLTVGQLPPKGGMVIIPSGGSTDDTYLAGGRNRHITAALLCKDTGDRAYNRLCRVCDYLETLRVPIPSPDGVQLTGFQITNGPGFVSRDIPGGPAIYSAAAYINYTEE